MCQIGRPCRGTFLGIKKPTNLEGSVDYIIDRNSILNRSSYISCSLACLKYQALTLLHPPNRETRKRPRPEHRVRHTNQGHRRPSWDTRRQAREHEFLLRHKQLPATRMQSLLACLRRCQRKSDNKRGLFVFLALRIR